MAGGELTGIPRLLTAGVLVIGIVYLVVTLIADLLYAALNPRLRLGGAES